MGGAVRRPQFWQWHLRAVPERDPFEHLPVDEDGGRPVSIYDPRPEVQEVLRIFGLDGLTRPVDDLGDETAECERDVIRVRAHGSRLISVRRPFLWRR